MWLVSYRLEGYAINAYAQHVTKAGKRVGPELPWSEVRRDIGWKVRDVRHTRADVDTSDRDRVNARMERHTRDLLRKYGQVEKAKVGVTDAQRERAWMDQVRFETAERVARNNKR